MFYERRLIYMEVKNGIIIDGVLHELKESNAHGCDRCSLKDLCNEEFSRDCICWIGLNSNSLKSKAMFFNRGKVKVEKEETK